VISSWSTSISAATISMMSEIFMAFVYVASSYRPTILRRLSPMRGSDWLAIPTRSSCACGKGAMLALAFVWCSLVGVGEFFGFCRKLRRKSPFAFHAHSKVDVAALPLYIACVPNAFGFFTLITFDWLHWLVGITHLRLLSIAKLFFRLSQPRIQRVLAR
jgi:hypothetical protein